VHRVVLLVSVIQMFSVLIDSVASEHVLHQSEGEVIFMVGSWSVIEDTNVGIDHLVISQHEKGWGIDWSLGAGSWDGG